MRSQKDPHFSDLCDRVGRGKITDEDEKYLRSRVQTNLVLKNLFATVLIVSQMFQKENYQVDLKTIQEKLEIFSQN